MSHTIFLVFLIIIFIIIGILMISYYRGKKSKRVLLDKILNQEIIPTEIKITSPDGDGYQSMVVSYLDSSRSLKQENLASHFDIEKTVKLLRKKNFTIQGSFVRK